MADTFREYLIALGFKIVATERTQAHFLEAGIAAERINKVLEGQPHIVDAMIDKALEK